MQAQAVEQEQEQMVEKVGLDVGVVPAMHGELHDVQLGYVAALEIH